LRKLIFLSLLIFISSCYKDKLGCLDVLAKNYNSIADAECIDVCCVYPTLSLAIEHTYNGEIMSLNKLYENNIKSSFTILTQKLFLSNISLKNQGESINFLTNESFTLLNGSSSNIEKSYVLLKDFTTSIDVNTYMSNIDFDTLAIQVGLNDIYNTINSKKATSYADLDESAGMYDESTRSYLSYIATIVTGTSKKDTLNLKIKADFNLTKNLKARITKKTGQDLTIPIKLNYSNLFRDINFTSPLTSIENKIGSNFNLFLEF
jgi:hypothetical protein